MLELVRKLGSAAAPEAAGELDDLIAAWRALPAGELDAASREALLWAALVQDEGQGKTPEELTALAGEVARQGSPFTLLKGLVDLTQAALFAGRLDVAERTTRFGTELPEASRAWTVLPRLWCLRSETARLAGRWDEMEASLDGLLTTLKPDEAFTGAYEPYLPANREFRARYHLDRARLKMETGLLEQAWEEIETGTAAAELCGVPGTLAFAYSVRLEIAMASWTFERVRELVADAHEQPWFDDLPPEHSVLFDAIEGICLGEQERIELLGHGETAEPPAPGPSEARRLLAEVVDSGLLAVPDRIRLLVLLADGALLRGELARARDYLTAIEALLGVEERSAIPPREASLSAALRWRALSRLAAAGGEGAPAQDELRASYEALLAAFDALLEQWKSIAPQPGGTGFLHVEWRTYLLETLIDATLELHPGEKGVEQALEHALEAQAMGSIARGRDLAAPTLDEIRGTLLGGGRVLLVLLPGRNGSHLFVLRAGSSECHALAPNDTLRSLAEPVVTSLRPGGHPVNAAALGELRDALLPASVQKLLAECDELYAHGFDRLHGLPLACLPLADGQILAASAAVSELSSLPLAVELARRGRTGGEGKLDALFVLAPDPRGSPGLDVLPFGADERSALVGAFDPARVAVLEGDRASPEALSAPGALDDVGILFVLAHTVRDEESPGSARLVLAAPGKAGSATFGVDDVRGLAFEGVVVLASCSAASAPPRLGDDALAHLGGAFLEAGARAVVLARNPVDYRKTLALFEHALARLAAGDPTAEALRAAYEGTLGPEPWRGFGDAAFQVLGLGLEPALAWAPRED